jgi:hypothetical protein
LPARTGSSALMTVEPEKLAIKPTTCSLLHMRQVTCVGEGRDSGIGVDCE